VRVGCYSKIRLSTWFDQAVVCLRSCSGATAIEYAIIAASVAVAIILALNYLGISVSEVFEEITAALDPGRRCVEVGSNCDKND
jgi:Flp pilus assembly pilin Flp